MNYKKEYETLQKALKEQSETLQRKQRECAEQSTHIVFQQKTIASLEKEVRCWRPDPCSAGLALAEIGQEIQDAAQAVSYLKECLHKTERLKAALGKRAMRMAGIE